MKKIRIFTALFVISGLVLCGCQKQNKQTADTVNDVVSVSASVQPIQINETISIVALGDNLLHMPVVNSGKQPDGSYEYSNIFKMVQPDIKNADIAVIG